MRNIPTSLLLFIVSALPLAPAQAQPFAYPAEAHEPGRALAYPSVDYPPLNHPPVSYPSVSYPSVSYPSVSYHLPDFSGRVYVVPRYQPQSRHHHPLPIIVVPRRGGYGGHRGYGGYGGHDGYGHHEHRHSPHSRHGRH
jgi:hypothetical protein